MGFRLTKQTKKLCFQGGMGQSGMEKLRPQNNYIQSSVII